MKTLITDGFDGEDEEEDVFDKHFRIYLEQNGRTKEDIARVLRRSGQLGGRNG